MDVATQNGTEIRERSTVETPAEEGRDVVTEARANLTEEYVAAQDHTTYMPWTQNGYIRSLPNPTDDLMRDFGSRLYEVDMPTDPQVYSTGSFLVMALLAQGVRLKTPVPRTDPDYEAAIKILRFCEYNFKNLKRSFRFEVLYELADSMLKMGHKVGEQIYELRTVTPEDGPQIVLTDIKTKPSEATAFVVDGFNNVLGLVYVEPGKPMPSFSSMSGDITGNRADGKPKMIPRSKFVVTVHKPRNGDPRGTSHYRSVYGSWWKKQQWNPQHLAFVTRFAQPSVIGNISKEAKDIPLATGQKSIVAATLTALQKIKGGAAGAFIDTEVEMLESQNEGKVIFDSFNHEDRQIAKGMLMQTLTTEEGKNMARAASAIHQDVFGILVAFLRGGLEWAIENDILEKLVRYNFGEEAARRLTPEVSLGGIQVQDVPSFMASLAQLANAKDGEGVHKTMWVAIRAMLGLPPADEVEEEEDWKRKREMEDAAHEALVNPEPEDEGEGAPAPKGRPAAGGDEDDEENEEDD
jgi:hypothetical protein